MPIFFYEASSVDEICDQVFAGEIPDPIASGTVRIVLNDNDAALSLTRANALGATVTGTLERADGTTCRFSATFRALISKDGEFRLLKEDIHSNC